MSSRALFFAVIAAAASALVSRAAPSDEPRDAASHGGVVLDVGGGAARVEFVHDPRTGTVTVYGMTEPGKTLVFNDRD